MPARKISLLLFSLNAESGLGIDNPDHALTFSNAMHVPEMDRIKPD